MKRKVVSDKKKNQLSASPTIMIVDDDKSLGNAFKRLLTISGYPVLKVAYSVPEAIQWLADRKGAGSWPKILLTDYHMGDMTGKDLVEYVRNNATDNETKTILMSGAANSGEIAKAGANIFLQKPVRMEELIGGLFKLVPHKIELKDAIKLSPDSLRTHNLSIINELTESQRNIADKIRHDIGNYLQPFSNLELLDLKEFKEKEDVLQEVENSLSLIKEMVEKLHIIFQKIVSAETVREEDLYSRVRNNQSSVVQVLKTISAVQQEVDNQNFLQFLEVFICEIDKLNNMFSELLVAKEEGWITKGVDIRNKMFQLLKSWFPVMY